MTNEEVKGSVETSTGTGEETRDVKTYTEEEVQALLQSEADRRVSSALKKQQKEFERRTAEAERLKNMDEAQRKDYEYTQKLEELERREREFTITQNKLEATRVLAGRGLPVEFVDYIVAEDADTMLQNINVFESAFKAAVADEVAKKISNPTPSGGSVKQAGMTKDDFKKLNMAQRAELYRTNPNLYRSITQN